MFKKILIPSVKLRCACFAGAMNGHSRVAISSEKRIVEWHVRLADEVINRSGESAESDLSIDKLMDVAKRAGATQLHPGYGFLAENFRRSRACARGNHIIGTSAEAMEKLRIRKPRAGNLRSALAAFGARARSNRIAGHCGSAANSPRESALGSVKGRGRRRGKGMRLVSREVNLILSARCRIGSNQRIRRGRMDNGKNPRNHRHIEIQILADTHGNS